jgi:hypothetical protein
MDSAVKLNGLTTEDERISVGFLSSKVRSAARTRVLDRSAVETRARTVPTYGMLHLQLLPPPLVIGRCRDAIFAHGFQKHHRPLT